MMCLSNAGIAIIRDSGRCRPGKSCSKMYDSALPQRCLQCHSHGCIAGVRSSNSFQGDVSRHLDRDRTMLCLQAGKRLDACLSNVIPNASRAKIQASIKAGLVSVNGSNNVRSSCKIKRGDCISCSLVPPSASRAEPEARIAPNQEACGLGG